VYQARWGDEPGTDLPLRVRILRMSSVSGTAWERSLQLLAAFAGQIQLMLHNARSFGDFTERYVETMVGLAASLDAGRPGAVDHHQRVSAVARTLAAGLELDGAHVEALATAGLIHDVGMAATAAIEGAFEADIQHPAVGASLIEHLPLHRAVAQAVACHHEWYDGWGFPEGLDGRAIPRAGRVLAMAEFLVEMSTPDVVRRRWSCSVDAYLRRVRGDIEPRSARTLASASRYSELAAEIRRRRGTQFDPEVSDVAVTLLESRAPDLVAARVGVDPPVTES